MLWFLIIFITIKIIINILNHHNAHLLFKIENDNRVKCVFNFKRGDILRFEHFNIISRKISEACCIQTGFDVCIHNKTLEQQSGRTRILILTFAQGYNWLELWVHFDSSHSSACKWKYTYVLGCDVNRKLRSFRINHSTSSLGIRLHC